MRGRTTKSIAAVAISMAALLAAAPASGQLVPTPPPSPTPTHEITPAPDDGAGGDADGGGVEAASDALPERELSPAFRLASALRPATRDWECTDELSVRPADGAIASLECVPGSGPSSVVYELFDDMDGMLAFFRSMMPEQEQAQEGECGEGYRQFTYGPDDAPFGRLACFEDGGSGWLVWSDEALLIVGTASQAEPRWKQLTRWWEEESGPWAATVPGLVSRPYEEAQALAVMSLTRPVVITNQSAVAESGTVLAQSPAAGSRVAPGSAVILEVAIPSVLAAAREPDVVGSEVTPARPGPAPDPVGSPEPE